MGWQRLGEPEGEPPFRREFYVFLAGSICAAGSSRRANGGTDKRSFTSARDPADQCPGAGASTDEHQIAFLVRSALHE